MDRWFFIEVQTYSSVNKMGLELGRYVFERYDQVVVHKDRMEDIEADIKKKIEELQLKYPRCKAFKYQKRLYIDRYSVNQEEISAKLDNQGDDRYIFFLRTKLVRNKNIETGVIW